MSNMEPANKQVAVIVPAFNVENYLGRCLDSIVGQTYTNLHVIVVDDGSNDRTPEILADYAKRDSRIQVVRQNNGGQATARNKALACLDEQDDCVCFVDSDDWIPLDSIAKLVGHLEKYGADIAIGRFQRVGENDEKGEISVIDLSGDIEVIDRDQMMNLLVNTQRPIYTVCWGKIYKAGVIRDFRFPEGKIYEDSACHHYFWNCRKVVFSKDIVYNWFQRQGSICHGAHTVRDLDKVEVYIERLHFLKSQGRHELASKTYTQAISVLVRFYTRIPSPDSKCRERANQLRNDLLKLYQNDILKYLSFKKRLRNWLYLHFFPLYVRVGISNKNKAKQR